MGGYDAVMGIQWLKDLSPTTFDFHRLELCFVKVGKQVCVKCVTDEVVFKNIKV